MTHTRIQAVASAALEAAGAPLTKPRIAVLEKHLAETDGVVEVVDAAGEVRLGAKNRPWTLRDLIEWLTNQRDKDARTLRWKPFGRSIV